ncbi:MAG: hypothetical protein JWP81_3799 [Ferruginibacter sp.]|nr:hypothetical protein [Ferruginibacter sp.]
MRFLKAFLFGATGLFIIITLFSLLIPFKVRVSRALLINGTTAGEVYRQVAAIENWKKWHPVFTADSAKLFVQPPSAGQKDSIYKILQLGKEITISFIPANASSVKFLLQAKGENDIENDLFITPLSGQQAVQVEWRAITRLHWYPWEKFYGIFIDKLTGPGYEAALQALKMYLENTPAPAG